jgi:hypothetical protein
MGFSHHRARANALTFFVCFLSLLVLIMSPIQRAHQFGAHYRTSEIRRDFGRHAYVAHSESNPSSNIVPDGTRPPFPAWIKPVVVTLDQKRSAIRSADQAEVIVPLSCLLVRLKLGSPSSGNQDPLA